MKRCFLLFALGARLRVLATAAVVMAVCGAAPAHAAVPQGTYHITKSVVHVNGTPAKTRASTYKLLIGAEGLAGVDDQAAEKLIKACFRSARMTSALSVNVTKFTATTLRGEFTGTLADGEHILSMDGRFFSATLAGTGLSVHGSYRNPSGSIKVIYSFLLKRAAR